MTVEKKLLKKKAPYGDRTHLYRYDIKEWSKTLNQSIMRRKLKRSRGTSETVMKTLIINQVKIP